MGKMMKIDTMFRAYHPEEMRMFAVAIINFTGNGTVSEHRGKAVITHSMSDVVLMQYTGLHDKDGKGIFGGDLVKSIIDAKQQGIVCFREGGYGIRWLDADYKEIAFSYFNADCDINDVYVVGNMCQDIPAGKL